MDAILFSLNRAFHKSVEVGLALGAEFGLTPSRYTLMYALLCERRVLRQCELQRLLGVSAPNVSRMVTSLEKLALVARKRDARGRGIAVELTRVGRARIKAAAAKLVQRGIARAAVRRFFPAYPFHSPAAARAENTESVVALGHALGRMRRARRDRALFEFPLLEPTRRPAPVTMPPECIA